MSAEQWKNNNTTMIGIRIQNKTGIPDALQYALTDSGLTKDAWIIKAILEKLIREGYMPAESDESNLFE